MLAEGFSRAENWKIDANRLDRTISRLDHGPRRSTVHRCQYYTLRGLWRHRSDTRIVCSGAAECIVNCGRRVEFDAGPSRDGILGSIWNSITAHPPGRELQNPIEALANQNGDAALGNFRDFGAMKAHWKNRFQRVKQPPRVGILRRGAN